MRIIKKLLKILLKIVLWCFVAFLCFAGLLALITETGFFGWLFGWITDIIMFFLGG